MKDLGRVFLDVIWSSGKGVACGDDLGVDKLISAPHGFLSTWKSPNIYRKQTQVANPTPRFMYISVSGRTEEKSLFWMITWTLVCLGGGVALVSHMIKRRGGSFFLGGGSLQKQSIGSRP